MSRPRRSPEPRQTFTVRGLQRMLNACGDADRVLIVDKKGVDYVIDAVVIGTDQSIAFAISPQKEKWRAPPTTQEKA